MTREEAYNILYCLLKEATKPAHIEALTVAVKDIVALERAKEGYEKIISALDGLFTPQEVQEIANNYLNEIK